MPGDVTAMSCILHVGTEKTGSTSLQRFLGLNVDALLARGVFVPKSLTPYAAAGNFNHLLLTTASRLVESEPDDLHHQIGLHSLAAVAGHRHGVIRALADEIAALSRRPSRLLVSNEHIHSRLRSDAELRQLKAMLGSVCAGFRIVVYLRPQHEVTQSLAITAVRSGAAEFRPLPVFPGGVGFDPVLGVDPAYLDYQALLARLGRVFGDDALDVRLYAKDSLIEGDIVADFFGRLNFDLTGLRRPMRENTSLDPTASLFLAALNRHLPSGPSGNIVREYVNDYTAGTHQGTGIAAASVDVERFMERFADSNEAVRSRWFPERASLFGVDFANHAGQRGMAVLGNEEAFRLFAEIIANVLMQPG